MSRNSIQDQYAGIFQQGQDAALAVVDAWGRSVRGAGVSVPSASVQAAALQVVDQYFDFARRVLDVQRGYAKTLVTSSSKAVEDAAHRTAEQVAQGAERAATRTR